VLRKVYTSPEKALARFEPIQQEWIALWYYVSGQRHGVGMAIGELIHSEVELDLRRKGHKDRMLDRTMDMILLADSVFRELSGKSQDRSSKGGSLDGVKAMVEEKTKTLAAKPEAKTKERKSRAV